MKYICILWLLLGFTSISFSQTLTIRDKESQEPIQLVSILCQNPKGYAYTNAKGQVDISIFKNAEKIEFRLLGYKKIVKSYAEIEALSFELYLETSSFHFDQIVISASRWQQELSNIPSKVISISPKEVLLQNPQTAADLLNISGEVYIQKSQQGGGSPMIRGFSTNRLLYTIDGVRMNNAIFRGGNIQNVISLDPFATENTEVFFGPGSVIYGSDAIGGVMSFQTLTPQLSLSEKPFITGKAVTRFSSANNEKTGHFDINIGWKKWALVTSISSFDFDHLRQGSHGPADYLKPYYVQRQDGVDKVITQDDPLLQIPSAYSQLNMMQKIRFNPNENWNFIYGFHYSETSSYGRYDRHNRVKNGLPSYAEWDYGPQKWMMNNLNIEHSSDHPMYDQLTIRLAQQSFEESRIERFFNKNDRTIRTEKVDAYSVNLDLKKSKSMKNSLFYGIEYVMNGVVSTGINENISTLSSIAGPSRYPQSTWQSIGAYINDQYKLSEKFLIQSGMRYNQFILNSEFDTTFYHFPFTSAKINKGAITGSIGGVFRPSEDWVVSTNFATAFRSPNVDDIGKIFDSEPGSVVVPNPDLKAEYAYNVDLGVAKMFGEVVKVDITGYYTLLQNAMVRRNFTLNGQDSILYDSVISRVQALQNAAKAHVYGIQGGVEVKLPAGFGFSSNLNFQIGKEELDNGTTSFSQHTPPMYGISRLTYKKNKVYIELYASYQAERKYKDLPVTEQEKTEIYALDKDGNPFSPSWYTLNFKAMYQLSELFTVSTGIENITDQRYRTYSSGISAPGRNFIFSLKMNF